MRITVAVLLTFLLILVVSGPLLAKATTTKVTISGVGLKTPIEISDPEIVANFTVWTRTADHGLIIDWSQGPLREPPDTLRRYQVSFYAGAPPNERIVYVVYYVVNPDASVGYVYLPGKSDEYYRLNTHSILRGEEGKWFPAWTAWERVARPLIEKQKPQIQSSHDNSRLSRVVGQSATSEAILVVFTSRPHLSTSTPQFGQVQPPHMDC